MKVKSEILFSMSLIILSCPLAKNVPELVLTLQIERDTNYSIRNKKTKKEENIKQNLVSAKLS